MTRRSLSILLLACLAFLPLVALRSTAAPRVLGDPDQEQPVITIKSPTPETSTNPVLIQVDIDDASDVTWRLLIDGVEDLTGATKGANAINVTRTLAPGTHRVRVEATDQFDNSSFQFVDFQLFGGKAKVNPSTVQFGRVKRGKSKTKQIIIHNKGTSPMLVEAAEIFPPFSFPAGGGPFQVAAKKKIRFPVRLSPSQETATGPIAGQVTLSTSDPDNPTIVVNLQGSVK